MAAARVVLIPASGAAAAATAGGVADRWLEQHPNAMTAAMPPSHAWPFLYPLPFSCDHGPLILWMPDLHEAAVTHQPGGTRLVTTQTSFLVQSAIAGIGGHEALCLITADHDRLTAEAPALVARRGCFASVEVAEVVGADHRASTPSPVWQAPTPLSASAQSERLAAAFRMDDSSARLAACVDALALGRTPAALVATASVCMEVNDLDAAARDLDEALALAPEWPAAWFERGKLSLRRDDMTRASEDFRNAADRMPGFGAAWANLGATLGELDRPAEALEAFEAALACDPGSHQAVNNIGVVQRELGQLAAAEASFRQVTALTPNLAFGYYNLGHTLFLQGRYQAALQAYLDGQRRDPDRNPVQATRLAMCRLASGDAVGALSDLRRATEQLPRDYRRQLLDDTHAIAWALLTDRPDLAGWRDVNDWLTQERQRL
jgi:tetratricopeptide (TPR) repeat protein